MMRPSLIALVGGTDRFRRNFVRITSANAVAQLIGVASLPILSRLYSPEAFGVFTVYTLVQSLFLAVVHARVDWIIPNARQARSVQRLMALGMSFTWVAVLALFVGLLTAPDLLAGLLNLPPDSPALMLLALGVLAGSFQIMGQAWYVFGGDLMVVGWSKLTQALVTLIVSLGLGWAGMGGAGLVAAYVAGFVAAALVLLGSRGAPTTSALLPRPKLVQVAHVYADKLFMGTALSIVNVAMTMSIATLLVIFYSTETVGWYGLVFRVAAAPIGLLTVAVVQSFWTDAALMAKTDPQALRRFYLGSVKRLSVLAAVLGIVFLLGPLYIPIIFGQAEWSGAGYLLAAVTPYLMGQIVFSPTTHLIVYNKMHWQLVCDLLSLFVSAAGFSLVALSGQPAWLAIAVSSTLILLGYIARFWLHLRANDQQVILLAKRGVAPSRES